MYNVLGKFPLSLHAVSQWGGRESLPSQGFQLEIGNDKQGLDLPSIPQNLNLNYTKNMQARAAGRIAPCRSYEQTGSTWKPWQGAGGSSDLSFWRRMVLSLSPAAAAAAGLLMGFSEKHRSWHLTTEWKCWICLLTAGIQICVYFYLTSLQRKFWKYKWMRTLQDTINLSLSFSIHSFFKLILEKKWTSEVQNSTKKPQVVDSLISVFPHGPSAWIYFQAKSPDNAEHNIAPLNPPVIIKNKQ